MHHGKCSEFMKWGVCLKGYRVFTIRVECVFEDDMSEWFDVNAGLRQGCVMVIYCIYG